MRSGGWIVLAVALMALSGPISEPAHALPLGSIGADAVAGAVIRLNALSKRTLVIDRPEIRSYQPYSGLQFGFRPKLPIQRGVRVSRPEIVMPRPVAPLIEYGPPTPYSAQWYAYCTEQTGSIEPRDGPYAGQPSGTRRCR